MTDVVDLTEIFSETLARVRQRMDADANAGVDIEDPAFIDIREGTFYWDMTQPSAMECARLWDAMTETVAAAFPSTAWGDYLDEHGATFALVRDPPVAATGQLTFTADQPTLVASGTQASSAASATGETTTFRTVDGPSGSGTTSASLPTPSGVTVTPLNTGGFLAAGTRYYHVTALSAFGESTGSADQVGVTTGTTGKNTIAWTAVAGATGYNIYVSQTPTSLGQLLATDNASPFVDDGTVTPSSSVVEPSTNTTSGITLAAQALEAGSAGNVAAGAITSLDSVLPHVLSVTNPAPMQGGTEEESDDDFRDRIIGEYVGTSGGGNVTDYKRWAASRGVSRVTVVPVWGGTPGAVLVIAMNGDGTPVSGAIVADLQAFLDPAPGLGQGQAPIGASVTVTTSVLLTIVIVAGVDGENGYTLDGTGNTIALRQAILSSINAYLSGLQPGDQIVYQHLQAAFFVPGVHKVPTLTVNGTTADIPLLTSPPQVPNLTSATLTDV